MKKIISICLVCILLVVVYNSKRDYYDNHLYFYDNSFKGEVTFIEEARGTKIFIEDKLFFYSSFYTGPVIKVHDYVVKNGNSLRVFRKVANNEEIILEGIALKPESSYFKYFF